MLCLFKRIWITQNMTQTIQSTNKNTERLILNIGGELNYELERYVQKLNTTKTSIVKLALEEFLSKKNATTATN